jgi:chloramphenicol 3-O phosphotransferase
MNARDLLTMLIERVADDRSISELVALDADLEAIGAQLRRVCDGSFHIDSIAGNDLRVDAEVTTAVDVARIVFALDQSGLVRWLHVYVKPTRFPGVAGGRVIVVNGPSGAGKSTLMRALQQLAPFPLVVMDEPEQIGTVQAGYTIWRDAAPALHRGYMSAIRALASAGNHVAVSAAGHGFPEIVDAFDGVALVRVGLFCDLQVLVRREQRTGRWAGIAAQSFGVHDGWTYDLSFDTTDDPDPLALAAQVLERVSAAS